MAESIEQAIARGRDDVEFWAWFFLEGQRLHSGQVEWIQEAEAQVNVGCTANRWGKTTTMCIRHMWRLFYKIGAEWRYVDMKTGAVDVEAYRSLQYETLHSAQGWETVAIVWEWALKYIEMPKLKPFIKSAPKSIPPHIEFMNGAKWRFRTVGATGQGIDGKSFYLITLDEAGWIDNLKEIVEGVARVRVADVQGMVDLMGTFKPGVSRDFFGYAVRAAVSTGRNIGFDFEDWQRGRAA